MIELMRRYLLYENGHVFVKEKFCSKLKVGRKMGYLHPTGYITIKFFGINYGAHRLIWEMLNGPIPEGLLVDHINQNKTDNRIENLRLATKSQNAMNSRKRNGTTKSKGVVKNKYGKFEVYIRVNGKGTNLGTYTTEEEAALVYNKAALRSFGQYANLNNHCGIELVADWKPAK